MSKSVNDKSRTEWIELIEEWVHDEINRAMLKRRLLDGVTFQCLSDEFNLSIDQCKKRVYRSQEQLFKHI
ncbi:MAG: hypothetical protein R3Y09_06610 [Clostridia bacterium]